MRIDSATVGMESVRTYARASYYGEAATMTARDGIRSAEETENQSSSFEQQLQFRKNNTGTAELYERGGTTFSRILSGAEEETEENDALSLDAEGLLEQWHNKMNAASDVNEARLQEKRITTYQEFRAACLEFLFRMLFRENAAAVSYGGDDASVANASYTGGGSGMSYTEDLTMVSGYYEREETSVQIGGAVQTADGRTIDFNLDLTMSRSFETYYEATYHREIVQDVNLWDPLVINLDTAATSLSDQSFYFDLDMDGEEDKIAKLCEGSGFLALDKNEDGMINDGSELFGAATGNGFAELAAYDTDKDGFIDEDDAIWSKLKVWVKDASGKDVLYTLSQAGVGAIYTGAIESEHSLKETGSNGTLGMVRKTGFYLKENGGTGTVQHVDIALQ
ncbi:MAG: hypothetical protein K5682_10430 [Lachnospiraceae bacterium]|nr:hypothetical protein [Lachnospiraceae bacterium]